MTVTGTYKTIIVIRTVWSVVSTGAAGVDVGKLVVILGQGHVQSVETVISLDVLAASRVNACVRLFMLSCAAVIVVLGISGCSR